MPVIDAHSHIYPDKIACKASSAVGDFYGVDMNAKNASASSMLAACEGSPITHHLVHSVATTPGQVPIINDFIAEQCRAHDNFVGFATMHQDFEDVEGEINRAIDLGLKGLKLTFSLCFLFLHVLLHKILYPMCHHIERFRQASDLIL